MVADNSDRGTKLSRAFEIYYNLVQLQIGIYGYIITDRGLLGGFREIIKDVSSVIRKRSLPDNLMCKTGVIAHPLETVYVPVRLIEDKLSKKVKKAYKGRCNFDFSVFYSDGTKEERAIGVILDGDWDLHKTKFRYSPAYIAFEERFVKGKAWEETIYYRRFFGKIRRRGIGRGKCKTVREFRDKCLIGKWEKLYEEIARNGYRSQREMGGSDAKEIEVCISRYGEILFRDGKHRLSIARILGVQEVPVVVNVWHKEYIDRVKQSLGCDIVTPGEAIQPILEGKVNGENEYGRNFKR